MKIVNRFLILLLVNILMSCSSMDTSMLDTVVECEEPRPQFCTMDFTPVCATRDNGVRCVTTPCLSIELSTYSNGCSACGDKKVFSYVEGACKKEIKEGSDKSTENTQLLTINCQDYDWSDVERLVQPYIDDVLMTALIMQGQSSNYVTSSAATYAMDESLPPDVKRILRSLIDAGC